MLQTLVIIHHGNILFYCFDFICYFHQITHKVTWQCSFSPGECQTRESLYMFVVTVHVCSQSSEMMHTLQPNVYHWHLNNVNKQRQIGNIARYNSNVASQTGNSQPQISGTPCSIWFHYDKYKYSVVRMVFSFCFVIVFPGGEGVVLSWYTVLGFVGGDVVLEGRF